MLLNLSSLPFEDSAIDFFALSSKDSTVVYDRNPVLSQSVTVQLTEPSMCSYGDYVVRTVLHNIHDGVSYQQPPQPEVHSAKCTFGTLKNDTFDCSGGGDTVVNRCDGLYSGHINTTCPFVRQFPTYNQVLDNTLYDVSSGETDDQLCQASWNDGLTF